MSRPPPQSDRIPGADVPAIVMAPLVYTVAEFCSRPQTIAQQAVPALALRYRPPIESRSARRSLITARGRVCVAPTARSRDRGIIIRRGGEVDELAIGTSSPEGRTGRSVPEPLRRAHPQRPLRPHCRGHGQAHDGARGAGRGARRQEGLRAIIVLEQRTSKIRSSPRTPCAGLLYRGYRAIAIHPPTHFKCHTPLQVARIGTAGETSKNTLRR